MKAFRWLTVGAVLVGATFLAASDAEARRGWRQSRWANSGRTVYSPSRYARPAYARSYGVAPAYSSTDQAWRNARRPSTGPVTYSGVSRAEQDFWRRRDAWYDDAYNGWRPEFFH